eukprot:COSAG01_NODE_37248_length_506_cov_0.847666_1_plen_54_part_10
MYSSQRFGYQHKQQICQRKRTGGQGCVSQGRRHIVVILATVWITTAVNTARKFS